jgi:MFS family permease
MTKGTSIGTGVTAGRSYPKHVILALLFVGWCLGNMDRMAMSFAVVPISKELGLSASLTGLVLSSFFIGYVIMQVPGGWLADKFGSRRVLLLIVFVWSIFTGFTGSAWSLASLLTIRVAFGLSEGSFSPSAIKLLSETFPRKESGRAIAILLMASGFMTVIVPIVSAAAIGSIGWRGMFYLIGSLGVVLIVLFWLFLRPRPAPAEPPVAAGDAAKAEPHSLRELLRMPMIWDIIVVSFAIYTLSWGFNTWLPTYLVQQRHLSLMSIGWLQIIPGIALMGGMYLGGTIVDALKPRWYRVLAVASSAISAAMIYLMYTCHSIALFAAWQTIAYLILGFLLAFVPAFLVKQVPAAIVGSATGLSSFGAQLAGFVTPLVIGVLVDAFKGSFAAAFGYLIIFALVSVVCFVLLRPRRGL